VKIVISPNKAQKGNLGKKGKLEYAQKMMIEKKDREINQKGTRI